jgi:fatty-acid desaturase
MRIGRSVEVRALGGAPVAGTVSGAITALIWGGLVRVFLAHRLTWTITSVCHTFGTCIRGWDRLGLVHNVHWPDATKLALRRSQAPVSAVA